MPQDLHGHRDASAHVPHWHFQITTQSLCYVHIQPPTPVSDVALVLSLLSSFTSYFILHMSTLAGMLKSAWRVGSRKKKEEAIVGKKKEKTGYFSLYSVSLLKARPKQMLMLELPLKKTF